MLQLLVLRHAKSDRNRPGKSDFDRSLNADGRDAARSIGRSLAARGAVPGLILCSPALRTRETLDNVAEAMETMPQTRFVDVLYEADHTEIMACVHAEGGDATPLLIIGHNPAVQEFALGTIGEGDGETIDQMRSGYPTGGLAMLETEIGSWQELTWRGCKLTAFERPGIPG